MCGWVLLYVCVCVLCFGAIYERCCVGRVPVPVCSLIYVLPSFVQVCGYRLEKCPHEKCHKRVKFMLMQQHLQDCPYRLVRCSFAASLSFTDMHSEDNTDNDNGKNNNSDSVPALASSCTNGIGDTDVHGVGDKDTGMVGRLDRTHSGEGCAESVAHLLRIEHEATCPYRPWSCPGDLLDGGCGASMRLKDRDTHLDGCPTMQGGSCPHSVKGCNDILPRHRVEDHIENHCEYRIIPCPNCDAGCKVKSQARIVRRHAAADCLFRPTQCRHAGCRVVLYVELNR